MRRRRLLLASTALSTMTLAGACGKTQPLETPKGSTYDNPDAELLPLPGNPKGSRYDESVPVPVSVEPAATDGGAPGKKTPFDEEPRVKPLPMPGNPKGSRYDGNLAPPDAAAPDGGARKKK